MTNELYHHGVKGMKWGVRKKRQLEVSDTRKNYDDARLKYKQAKKGYSKSYNEAYNYSNSHPVSQFTNRKRSAESDRRWDEAIKKADELNKAKANYKRAKRDRRVKIDEMTKAVNKSSSAHNRLIFNDATRRKAAKYIVDHNMSMDDAIKKANGEAIRNSAALIAAYGAVKIVSSTTSKKPSYSVLDEAGKVIKNFY